ncbi:MAG: RdgB/HAM1 family non-canonical purine NTP pyrophosphatase [Methylomonas sp.]|nr:RdgB/HAM1 family non-canonical purine NTP pyrophosphatase [Methylomonas sp.]PPD24053.1 MAG: non-canonical purine NTP pyrophosphatase, RdgB/HAM1 family [Methylomonas sp.]PPD32412.1 MAG: non-canonical purine NTP pyrophosphatase, RdgB/HAM1 family [Methylomonas sp.]PPD53180.1 MAG: non-canonical purine NTP pyrophosphatase, RdgB/HAM1 family [Methylomonas sp.]
MSRIVLASGNAGKIREIQAMLQGVEIIPQSQLHIAEPDETGCTFVENALIKARNAARHSGLPAIADDSGLVVDALNGAPGVISARYAGVGASDQANIDKLLLELADVPDERRTARFICLMVFMRHADDPTPVIAHGVWEGQILHQASGSHGFGYDPVFWVEQHRCSAAQLSPEVKNALSHRGQALRVLSQQLRHGSA